MPIATIASRTRYADLKGVRESTGIAYDKVTSYLTMKLYYIAFLRMLRFISAYLEKPIIFIKFIYY